MYKINCIFPRKVQCNLNYFTLQHINYYLVINSLVRNEPNFDDIVWMAYRNLVFSQRTVSKRLCINAGVSPSRKLRAFRLLSERELELLC